MPPLLQSKSEPYAQRLHSPLSALPASRHQLPPVPVSKVDQWHLPNGKFVRQAAKTRSWETAERKARLMEAQADPLENAFVLRAAPSSDFETGKLEGMVLHVESGRELEFRSVKEIVTFVSECMTHNRGKGPGH